MAKLPPYVANGTTMGSKESIWVKFGFPYFNVGSGSVTAFSTYAVSFQGTIDVAGIHKGPLDLSLELTDQNPNSTSGPCSVSINGHSDNNATYAVSGGKLVINATFETGGQNMTVYPISGGSQTEIDLSGIYDHAVHLAPS